MKCPKCQFENPEDSIFCGSCGLSLEIELICSNCGARPPTGFKFCNKCGHNLKAQKKALPIDFNQPQSYTPKFLADKILTNRSSIEGERKLVTVLFADVVNYTSMSEKLDPEEVHQIMDGCFKILMEEIHKYEGTINQFTGDGVMALFGAPVSHEDHAQRACYAALSIQNSIGDYGEKIKEETGVEFKMRIGINSGLVIVGSIGDDLRMDYTALGDTTNLASRMESNASPGTVLLSKNTQRLVRDYFELNSLGRIEIKGKGEPQEAFELIRAGDVDTRMGASVSKGLTRFVGRKNSMATVMEAFETTKSGSGHILAVVGEAGVGKSRLLIEMRNKLSEEDISYLEGRCLHYGGSMAYLPILDILRSYFDIQEGDREYIIKKKMKEKVISLDEKLVSLLPFLQELLSLTVDDDQFTKLEPKVKREKTFEALRDLLIRISNEKPFILAIEDLHWIDRTSEEFLDYLIGWLTNSPILLILLYRPEYTHQWASKSYYTQIGLNQLGTASSSELIRAILEEGKIAPELKQLILERAAGNPLFMEEFTHTLLENGSIEKRNEQYVLNRKPSEILVPETIQGIIAARMDRLEENVKRIMQVASVIGREFAFRILQTITGMREELKSGLLNLQGLEFIYEKSLFPELEYIFKHALTQEVAYNSLLSNRRKEIHKQIAGAIESIYAERLEEFYEVLAYHYSKGENIGKACYYLKLSGNKAMRSYAVREAYVFYKDALDLLNRLPETEEKKRQLIEAIERMINPVALLGLPEESLSYLQQGERLAKDLGDSLRLARFYSSMGSYYSHAGNYRMAIRYTEDAFKEAKKTQDIELMSPLAYSLCMTYLGTGRCLKIIDTAPSVIDLIERKGREIDMAAAVFMRYPALCGTCGSAMGHLGQFEKGKALLEKGLRNAVQENNLPTLGLTELYFCMLYYCQGAWQSAKIHAEKCIAYSEKAKFLMVLANGFCAMGSVNSFLDNPEVGRMFAEKGLQIYREIGNENFLSYWHWAMGGIHLDLNDLDNARVSMEESLRLSRKNGEKGWEGLSWIGLGRVLENNKRPLKDEVEASFLKGLEILDVQKLKPFYAQGRLFLGEFYLDTGEKAKAMENLKEAEAMFQEMGMDYWLNRTRGLLGGI